MNPNEQTPNSPEKPDGEEQKVNYYHVPYKVTCPSCKYEGSDGEFNLTWKGPDAIRVCPNCGNGHVIAMISSGGLIPVLQESIGIIITSITFLDQKLNQSRSPSKYRNCCCIYSLI